MSVEVMSLIFQTSLPVGAKMVGLCLADFAGADGTRIFPAISTICRRTSFSRRAVQRILRRLESMGLIKPLDQRQHRVVEYRFVMDKLRELSTKGDPESTKGDPESTKGDPESPNPPGTVRKKREDDSAEIMKQAADQPVEIEPVTAPAAESPSGKKQGAARCKTRAGEQVVSHRQMLQELAQRQSVARARSPLSDGELNERRRVLQTDLADDVARRSHAQARELKRDDPEQQVERQRAIAKARRAEDRGAPDPGEELVSVGSPTKKKNSRERSPGNGGRRGRRKSNFVTAFQQ